MAHRRVPEKIITRGDGCQPLAYCGATGPGLLNLNGNSNTLGPISFVAGGTLGAGGTPNASSGSMTLSTAPRKPTRTSNRYLSRNQNLR
jgi:hypothetical protein